MSHEEEIRQSILAAHPELADDLAKVPPGYYPILAKVVHFDGVDHASGYKKRRTGAVYISDIAPYPKEA